MANAPLIQLDTHVLVWWLTDSRQLSSRARRAIGIAARQRQITASAASILEIATLVRRGRLVLTMTLEQWLADLRALPEITIVPVNAEIAARAGAYGDAVHGDPADRMIIATAQLGQARLVTADAAIRSLRVVPTIW